MTAIVLLLAGLVLWGVQRAGAQPWNEPGYIKPHAFEPPADEFIAARKCLDIELIWGMGEVEAVKCQTQEGFFMFVREETE